MTGLSRKQAAELAGVRETTIIGWQAHGRLQASLPGTKRHFSHDDVLAAQQAVHAGDVIPRWRADPQRAGHRLRLLREAAGITQQELAARSGVSNDLLSILEHGKRSSFGATVHQLSSALGIAPRRFVDDTPIGPSMLTTAEAGHRLNVPASRIQDWVKGGVLPAQKIGGRWRIPAVAVEALDRSGRLRGKSRRLD